MANLVFPGGGAILGYMVGGPVGAQLGWVAGSVIAGTPDLAPMQIGDLTIQTSEYGIGINRIVGTQRCAGNVIWYGDKTKYTRTTGGGKGGAPGQQIQGWSVDFAIGICIGPIVGIRKVWSNGQLIIDCSSGVKPLPGQLYLGNNTQNPDPTIEASEGAGNVPAYRGIAYMVMNNFDLGQTGVLPQLSFEVVKDGTI